jgi:hypothetical protein
LKQLCRTEEKSALIVPIEFAVSINAIDRKKLCWIFRLICFFFYIFIPPKTDIVTLKLNFFIYFHPLPFLSITFKIMDMALEQIYVENVIRNVRHNKG